MRIRWRDLELPTRVVCVKETLTPVYGEFIVEPFERGFGRSVGNSLRRILLSAIEGCAVASVKIKDIDHEFSTIPGVLEDVADIILNVKRIRLSVEDDAIVYIKKSEVGPVTAGDIQSDDESLEVHNKDLVIAHITEKLDSDLEIELQVKRGRGYVEASENMKEPQEIGVIPVDSIYSPVQHVEYQIENTRVGKMTNYDRLILKITTDGTLAPEMVLVEAAKILRKHLNPFVQYFELGQELQEGPQEELISEADENLQKIKEKLLQPIEVLELSVRASNCLAAEGIRTIKDLVKRQETDMMKIRNFGKTSLKEIKEKLIESSLSLGMQVEEILAS
ncbi:DNA-directed RNA polymerase subunit alpha [Candidatus Uabimicrobium sp. HlEnr_7]|uniref:DNA-directed RNA polymerase subunit alpha n=1 Tax=Candidatus Uabimicrobium helgolandensis TaxID=3095367 RepID=UPI003557D243